MKENNSNSQFEIDNNSSVKFENLENFNQLDDLKQLLLHENNKKEENYDDYVDKVRLSKKIHGKKSEVLDIENIINKQNKHYNLNDILMLESTFYKQVPKNNQIQNPNTNTKNNTKNNSSLYNQTNNLSNKSNPLRLSKIKKNESIDSENENLIELDESFLDEFTGSKNFTEVQFNSLLMTIFQIMNCIIKSSLVQICYCMKTLGIIYGSMTIIIVAFFSLISLKLLMGVHERTKIKSYLSFSDRIFGKFGKFILLTLNFGSAYGNCLTFIKIFMKVIPIIINLSMVEKSEETYFIKITLGIILFFYCFKKDVSGIKKAAYYGFLGIILFFIFTILDFSYTIYKGQNLEKFRYLKIEDIFWGMDKRITAKLNSIACIILSFSFHIFTFSIYGCMGEISITEFNVTAAATIFICAIIYLLCGIIGFLLYYDEIYDSILDASKNKFLYVLLSLSNCLNVIMTFPITFAALKNYWCLLIEVFLTVLRNFYYYLFCCCQCIQNKKKKLEELKEIEVNNFFGNANSVMMPKFMEVIFVIILFISVFKFEEKVTEFKFIFGILGGLMGNTLSFIFPALFYLIIENHEHWYSLNNIISVFFVIIGFICMIACLTSTIIGVTE